MDGIGPARIVVLEDNADTRVGLRLALQARGFDVLDTADGNEALDWISGDKPAAILLDLYMPNMDGFEFYGLLRGNPRNVAIPVVVVTAAPPEARVGLTGVEFIRKPIDMRELMFTLDRVMRH